MELDNKLTPTEISSYQDMVKKIQERNPNAKVELRISEQNTRLFVDYEEKGRKVSYCPTDDFSVAIENSLDLEQVLKQGYISRERSRAFVRGEVKPEEFEGKYIPPEVEEALEEEKLGR